MSIYLQEVARNSRLLGGIHSLHRSLAGPNSTPGPAWEQGRGSRVAQKVCFVARFARTPEMSESAQPVKTDRLHYRVVHQVVSYLLLQFRHSMDSLYKSVAFNLMSTIVCVQPDGPPCTLTRTVLSCPERVFRPLRMHRAQKRTQVDRIS